MDSPGTRLRKARTDAGFRTAEAAAKRFHWRVAGYRHHENGTRDFDKDKAREYAKAYGVEAAWLLCLPGGRETMPEQSTGDIEVLGEAAMGVWREQTVERLQHVPEKRIAVPVVTSVKRKGQRRFAVKVADASVDKLFPVGWHVVCVPLGAAEQTPENFAVDDVLYIERTRRDLRETSLRRVAAVEANRLRLATHSADPKLKHELTYPPANGSVEKIALLGKVVGRYGDFPG